MGINIRQKGQEGEREIQRALEPIIRKVMSEGGFPLPDKAIVQRNQNQSAVGGSDLSNTFGLCDRSEASGAVVDQYMVETVRDRCERQWRASRSSLPPER